MSDGNNEGCTSGEDDNNLNANLENPDAPITLEVATTPTLPVTRAASDVDSNVNPESTSASAPPSVRTTHGQVLTSSTPRSHRRGGLTPDWITEIEGYFRGLDLGPRWSEILDLWLDLEDSLRYPDGKVGLLHLDATSG